MFRIIALPRLHHEALAQATRVADSRACADLAPADRGVPRTAGEWTALIKIASGEPDVPLAHCERLLALGLIERNGGVPELTRHGRCTLGLSE
jgi:hypothetical protein